MDLILFDTVNQEVAEDKEKENNRKQKQRPNRTCILVVGGQLYPSLKTDSDKVKTSLSELNFEKNLRTRLVMDLKKCIR